MTTKQEVLTEIDHIISRVKATKGGRNVFVCIQAGSGRIGDIIREMVKRHIGHEPTMNCFLHSKKVKGSSCTKTANIYRLMMLNNMKKMVQKEYK